MNLLNILPALIIYLLFTKGLKETFFMGLLSLFIQIGFSLPFLLNNWKNYLYFSYQFNRKFIYKWSINWKFLSETIFQNNWFHLSLLILQLSFIIYILYKWIHVLSLKQSWKIIIKKLLSNEIIIKKVSTNDTIYLFALINFIGIIFSRTLHYQFYTWYFWSIPFLLRRFNNYLTLILFGLIELIWNIFPSNEYSSISLLILHLIIFYNSI
jgi:alpha-1,3-mannosyltransferase